MRLESQGTLRQGEIYFLLTVPAPAHPCFIVHLAASEAGGWGRWTQATIAGNWFLLVSNARGYAGASLDLHRFTEGSRRGSRRASAIIRSVSRCWVVTASIESGIFIFLFLAKPFCTLYSPKKSANITCWKKAEYCRKKLLGNHSVRYIRRFFVNITQKVECQRRLLQGWRSSLIGSDDIYRSSW